MRASHMETLKEQNPQPAQGPNEWDANSLRAGLKGPGPAYTPAIVRMSTPCCKAGQIDAPDPLAKSSWWISLALAWASGLRS